MLCKTLTEVNLRFDRNGLVIWGQWRPQLEPRLTWKGRTAGPSAARSASAPYQAFPDILRITFDYHLVIVTGCPDRADSTAQKASSQERSASSQETAGFFPCLTQ